MVRYDHDRPLTSPIIKKSMFETGTPNAIRKAILWTIPIAIAFCGLAIFIASKLPVLEMP